jgi:ABC-type glycerol-3-phosphate transport system permease component
MNPRSYGVAARLIAIWMVLAVLALSAIYPLVFLVMTAFRTNADYLRDPAGVPSHFTLANVSAAFANGLGHYAINSLIVVSAATALLTVVACMAGYALTQLEFPFRRTIFVLVVAMIGLPPAVLMIPIFRVVLTLGLLNTRQGLVLVLASLNLPFSIYLTASYMRSVPHELINAARVDGASTGRTLRSVVLPLIKPGVMTLITLNFLVLWNELLFSLLILPSPTQRTIMVGIAEIRGQYDLSPGGLAAGLMLSMLPPLMIFALFQRDLARGLTAGAVK